MAINKVEYNGKTLIDLTNDTVTDNTLIAGATAHSANGEQIVGAFDPTIYLEKTGNASNVTTAFVKATARANIETGEALTISMGKIAKNFADIKGHAFEDTVNNLTTTVAGNALDATQGKVLSDAIAKNANDISTINNNLNGEISRAKEADEILKSRVDNITSLSEGSTTGDAELQDIRVKYDGTTAENAGNAVREQFSELKSDLSKTNDELSDDRNSLSTDFDISYQAIRSGYIETGKNIGEVVSIEPIFNNSFVHFIITVKKGYRFKVSGVGGYPARQWCFVDNDNKVVSVSAGGVSGESNIVAPNDGYLICNFTVQSGRFDYSVKYTGYIGYAKSIENAIEELEDGMSVDFNMTNMLILGGYIENQAEIGTPIRPTVTKNESWYYRQIIVKRGEVYKVIGQGGYSARLWSLYDNKSFLIAIAEAGASGEHIVRVEQDGYLIVNTQKVENIGLYKIGALGFKDNFINTQKRNIKKFAWTDKPEAPYWIISIDCAKKYFSVANIKTVIDLASSAGFNQLQMQLTTNMGFRFELDNDMVVTDINGNSYDLTTCLGGVENPTGWYTIAEMDDIISYSKSKGIDFYPFFEMPAHMKRILEQFPQFSIGENHQTLDVTNEDAVNFSVAILDKYAKYFASRGCHFFNFGFDEQDFGAMYADSKFDAIVNYGNLLIETIKKNGLQPRMYNDAVQYNNDYRYQFDRDVEVLCWRTYGDEYAPNVANFNMVQKASYKVINSSSWFYYIDGSGFCVAFDTLKTLNLLKYYSGINKYFEHLPMGAVFSVWCDQSVTENPNDNGDKVLSDIAPIIEAFGSAIKTSLTVNGF